jgi:hypothetical protein
MWISLFLGYQLSSQLVGSPSSRPLLSGQRGPVEWTMLRFQYLSVAICLVALHKANPYSTKINPEHGKKQVGTCPGSNILSQ